jgi:hypothetical protein
MPAGFLLASMSASDEEARRLILDKKKPQAY